MDLGLTDRVALVVGGTGYLGSAISTRVRTEGAVVLTASRSGDGDLALDEPDTVREGLDAKTLTFLRLARAALPVMREAGFGRIVGISGQNAYLTGSTVGAVRNAALNITAKTWPTPTPGAASP